MRLSCCMLVCLSNLFSVSIDVVVGMLVVFLMLWYSVVLCLKLS